MLLALSFLFFLSLCLPRAVVAQDRYVGALVARLEGPGAAVAPNFGRAVSVEGLAAIVISADERTFLIRDRSRPTERAEYLFETNRIGTAAVKSGYVPVDSSQRYSSFFATSTALYVAVADPDRNPQTTLQRVASYLRIGAPVVAGSSGAIAVGDPLDDSSRGLVRVYVQSSSGLPLSWSAPLTVGGMSMGDRFGAALSCTTAAGFRIPICAIGAPGAVSPGSSVRGGAVYVYEFGEGSPRLVASLADPMGAQEGAEFGSSLQLHGSRTWLAVGAPGFSHDGVAQAGKAFLFQRDPSTERWSLARTPVLGTRPQGRLGHAVGLQPYDASGGGDSILFVVSELFSWFASPAERNARVWLHNPTPTGWASSTIRQPRPGDIGFGLALGMPADRHSTVPFAVGAPREGAVYLYSVGLEPDAPCTARQECASGECNFSGRCTPLYNPPGGIPGTPDGGFEQEDAGTDSTDAGVVSDAGSVTDASAVEDAGVDDAQVRGGGGHVLSQGAAGCGCRVGRAAQDRPTSPAAWIAIALGALVRKRNRREGSKNQAE